METDCRCILVIFVVLYPFGHQRFVYWGIRRLSVHCWPFVGKEERIGWRTGKKMSHFLGLTVWRTLCRNATIVSVIFWSWMSHCGLWDLRVNIALSSRLTVPRRRHSWWSNLCVYTGECCSRRLRNILIDSADELSCSLLTYWTDAVHVVFVTKHDPGRQRG